MGQLNRFRYFVLSKKLRFLTFILTLLFIYFFHLDINKKLLVWHQEKIAEELATFRVKRFLDYQNREVRLGPGENGTAVTLSPEQQELAKSRWKNASFNVMVSDLIALDRSIPDTRRKE